MGRGPAGRADGRGTFKAGDDGAVGGSAVGLPAMRGRTFLECFDRLQVDGEGLVEELLEKFGWQNEVEFREQEGSCTLS